ncbi:hypothetical protein ACVVI9_004766 [Escherichia coli]
MIMQSLSLEPAILQQYWQDVSQELGELFSLLETHESWVADKKSGEIENRLIQFGKKVDELSDPSVLLTASRSDLLVFFCYLSSSKAMRLLDYLESHTMSRGLGNKLLEHLFGVHEQELAEIGASPQLIELLAARLEMVLRAPYLREIFRPERIHSFANALRVYHESKE